MEQDIIDLLAGRKPTQVRDFFRLWDEKRNASFMDASREAEPRSASRDHVAQVRGQLRFHHGEIALGTSAVANGFGAIPLKSQPPGGVSMVARIGRFGLVSLCLPQKGALPRRSVTRKLLSGPNEALDTQTRLSLGESSDSATFTDLAYFGCVIAIPWRRDPSVPAQLAFAVPNASVTDWLAWIPLSRLHAILQDQSDRQGPRKEDDASIPDNAIPRFRLPRADEAAGNNEP